MSNQFSFFSVEDIQKAVKNLELIAKNYKADEFNDKELILAAKKLLENFQTENETLTPHFEKLSVETRDREKNYIQMMSLHQPNEIEKIPVEQIDNFLQFLALLSQEIVTKDYFEIENKKNLARHEAHKNIVDLFSEFIDLYLKSNQDGYNKKRVEIYPFNLTLITAAINEEFKGESEELGKNFNKILEDKEKTKSCMKLFLEFMAVVMLAIPGFIFFIIQNNLTMIQYFFNIIPIAAFEILLIYFFRIILKNYYQIKAEIIQLEIRKFLSDFIYAYYQFTKDKQDNYGIRKYSGLIFSPLVMNGQDIPKVTDGADAIANLLKSFRGEK